MEELKIGVTGYSAPRFNQDAAMEMLIEAYDMLDAKYPGVRKAVVSGLTNLGIPLLAYQEAVKRNWRTVGIACKKAEDFDCFPVDESIIVGNDWGEESPAFLNAIDVFVRIGGGNQAKRETLEAKAMGKEVIEYELLALNQGGK